MSFSFYLQRVRNDAFAPFKRSVVAEVVGIHGQYSPNGEITGTHYSDQDGGEIYGTDEEEISNMSFSRASGERFMQMVWDIADRTQSYIFWHNNKEYPEIAVTSAEAASLVPASVIKSLSLPQIVNDGRELSKAIFGD